MDDIENVLFDMIKKIEKKNRKIKINDSIEYFFIPTKREIIEEKLVDDIWWTKEETELNQFICKMELQQFMKLFPNNDIRTVARQLWLVFDFDEIYRQQNL
jgi:hypothetical protein